MTALLEPINLHGKLVPHAVLDAEIGEPLLAEQAGDLLASGMPRHMTPDRFPQFTLLRGVVRDIQRQAGGAGPADGPRSLRDSAYEKRVQEGGLPGLLWAIGGGEAPPEGPPIVALALRLLWLPL
ncbi:hypothetical protein [Candidatus Protofrankia datiscae]|uniref:hypothetical protein n=1 Tax=Candidatus Protofrankia datiscae TaxID=2716812 RepID=UPI0010416CF9|nr:hypothetical protein [Candidatus Protofrankia datiscae]